MASDGRGGARPKTTRQVQTPEAMRQAPSATKEGWLYVQKKKRFGLGMIDKRRYCVLHGAVLEMYKNDAKTTIKRSLSLQYALGASFQHGNTRFTIHMHSAGQDFVFTADSKEDAVKWVYTLKAVIKPPERTPEGPRFPPSAMSKKDDLVHENDRLAAEVSRLKVGLDEFEEMFQNMKKTFVESKAIPPMGRYSALKDMIKKVTSEEVRRKVHLLSENQATKEKGMSGFSDDATDIRCLDKEDIRQDNDRKRREIQRMNRRGLRAYNKVDQLNKRYQASKAMRPHTRYQELKDMIKDNIRDDKM